MANYLRKNLPLPLGPSLSRWGMLGAFSTPTAAPKHKRLVRKTAGSCIALTYIAQNRTILSPAVPAVTFMGKERKKRNFTAPLTYIIVTMPDRVQGASREVARDYWLAPHISPS
jgi:hypothetical protein